MVTYPRSEKITIIAPSSRPISFVPSPWRNRSRTSVHQCLGSVSGMDQHLGFWCVRPCFRRVMFFCREDGQILGGESEQRETCGNDCSGNRQLRPLRNVMHAGGGLEPRNAYIQPVRDESQYDEHCNDVESIRGSANLLLSQQHQRQNQAEADFKPEQVHL